MVMGLLTKLASFSLRNPKTVVTIVLGIVLMSFAAHYKLILAKNAELKIEREAYQKAAEAFIRREAQLTEDARVAAEATKTAIAERETARAALDTLRRGREDDPESAQWGAQPIPAGELARLCAALPELKGC